MLRALSIFLNKYCAVSGFSPKMLNALSTCFPPVFSDVKMAIRHAKQLVIVFMGLLPFWGYYLLKAISGRKF